MGGQIWRAGIRALLRDWRAGELRFLFLALVVAAAAVASIGFLADRVHQALAGQSAQMLGGDLVLHAGDPITPETIALAHTHGLTTSLSTQMSSMASTDQGLRLVSLKAVDEAYPLRGQLLLHDPQQAGGRVAGAPPLGGVWVDAQLAGLLTVQVGDTLQLGESLLTVAGIIQQEPDRGVQFINMAPRVMMHAADLPATGLAGPLSRMHHTLAGAGNRAGVSAFHDALSSRLKPGQSVVLPGQARPEIQRSLTRAHQFLVLVALLAVVMAALAVALAARLFHGRHESGFAVMRSLGASRLQLGGMLTVEFLLLGAGCAALGVGLGFILQELLSQAVARWLAVALPAVSWVPAWQGLATCWLLLLGFALPSVASLCWATPVQVLRQSARAQGPGWVLRTGVALAAFVLLAGWVSADWRMSVLVCLAFALGLGVFMLMAHGAVWLGPRLLRACQGLGVLRWVVVGMWRRRQLVAVQIGALATGLMVLLLLMLIRTDLLAGWQNALPDDAPNTFLLNIQADQREAVEGLLQSHGVAAQPLVPMVRGRLVAVNGVAAESRDYAGDRARRMVEREFNLSYQAQMPASNDLVAGRWLDPEAAEVSLEADLAETLNITLDDRLTFDIAGDVLDVQVTSLREVKWDSFDVNFFALISPTVLAAAPATFITAFHLPDDQGVVARALLSAFPNLTVVDVGVMLAQVRRIVAQGTQAVQVLFLFAVAAGLLVLGVSFVASREERMREVAMMRALGAQGPQLRRMLRLEMTALGLLAGVLAALGAMGLAQLLAHQVFDFYLGWSWWPLVVGVLAGITAAMLSGVLTLRSVLQVSPMRVLREAV